MSQKDLITELFIGNEDFMEALKNRIVNDTETTRTIIRKVSEAIMLDRRSLKRELVDDRLFKQEIIGAVCNVMRSDDHDIRERIRKGATQAGELWSQREDASLAADYERALQVFAEDRARSVGAIRCRINKLRGERKLW